VRGVTYEGDVVLKGSSGLDTYTQVFWSDKAGDTVSVFVSYLQQVSHLFCRVDVFFSEEGLEIFGE